MSLDDKYIYVFVRQDLALVDQVVSVGHACFHLGLFRTGDGLPSIVAIGVPHTKAMDRVKAKLIAKQLPHYDWEDPDFKAGVTAIAVGPLSRFDKEALANYRLLSYSPGAPQGACLLTEDGGAKADLAQLREHSVSNREVEGANPSVGSNLSQGEAQ